MCETESCETPVTQDLVCDKTEHIHSVEAGCYHKHSISSGCYALQCGFTEESVVCGKTEAACTQATDVCLIAGTVGHDCSADCVFHVHNDDCSHAHKTGCKHVHVESCYAAEPSCGLTEEAAVANLICTKEVHTHANAEGQTCYVDHVHGEACYKKELTCTIAEHTHTGGCAYGPGVVAVIDETTYTTLTGAVEAANADTESDAVEIQLVDDVEFSSAMTIKRDVNITGTGTITRADNYKGTLFIVNSGVEMTLDGVTIDGGNNWTLNPYYYDVVLQGMRGTAVDDEKVKYAVSEPGAPVANDYLIKVNGKLVIYDAAIQNNFGYSLINVGSNAELITDGTKITHNSKVGGSLVAKLENGAKWTSEEGTEISYNHADGGFGVLAEMRTDCDFIINGGKYFENSSVDVNGVLIATYSTSAYIEINGGEFYHNWASYGDDNNWNGIIYLNAKQEGSKLVMNGGHIYENYAYSGSGISTNGEGVFVELNGGVLDDAISGTDYIGPDSSFASYLDVTGNVSMTEGRVYNDVDVAENAVLKTGTLFVNGAYTYANYIESIDFTGGGTVNGNIYLHNGAEVTLKDGTWTNGLVTLDAVERPGSLTVKPGAVINGVQVRVLDSVASGDCTDAEQAAAVQKASYIKEDGAAVASPVLFYHRLTAAQKQKIVVTYDYNGGLDAFGWSGTQVTTENETYVPTAEELAKPTLEGYKLVGWNFAAEQDPESLSMAGDEVYYTIGDEEAAALTQTLRLIAQWEKIENNTPSIVPPYVTPETDPEVNPEPPFIEVEDPEVPLDEPDVPLDEPDVPLAESEVEIEEEETPLTDIPKTADSSSVILWMTMVALSAMVLLAIRVAEKREY